MSENVSNFLSKSSVNSTPPFSKSPYKNSNFNPVDSTSTNHPKTPISTWKEWKPDTQSYNVQPKVTPTNATLRQTFDTRTNSRIQQRIAQYDKNLEEKQKEEYCKNPYLRQTMQANLTPTKRNVLIQSTAVETIQRKAEENKINAKKQELGNKGHRGSYNFDKFKNYMEYVDKFQDQLETTKKVSEEIKKLKQDRKKRLQEKTKEETTVEKIENNETFKKKSYYDHFPPKTPKDSNQRYMEEKVSSKVENYPFMKKEKSPLKLKTKEKAIEDYDSPSLKYNKPRKFSAYLSNGAKLYDFNLGETLGEGKFGTVFKAIHKKTNSIYAIKKVPKDMIKSHLMIDQFILELKLQSFLNHQNILSLHTYFDDDKHIYIVLEYMEGGTLFTHLKKNKVLPELEVAIKIRQIASAIKYLHENTIAHRDIKPENVVISHGVCKLCDFGWATVCDDRRKTYCGTFDYAPPEILEGAEYDFTVDLWCLGILTYQLLVGKAPFYHISRKETLKRILNVEHNQIEYPQNLSKNSISFIDSLLRKNPKQRMSSDFILEHPFLKNVQRL